MNINNLLSTKTVITENNKQKIPAENIKADRKITQKMKINRCNYIC